MTTLRTATLPSVSSHVSIELESDALIDSRSVPSLRHRWFAGETLREEAVQALAPHMPSRGLCQLYGLTEHTARVSVKRIEDDFQVGRVGVVLPGVTVEIADVGLGDIGEIVLKSDSVCLGYAGGRPLAKTPSGFLRTGDLGLLDSNGELIMRGRVISRGVFKAHSFWLTDIEAEICMVEGVVDCVAKQPEEGAPLECEVVLAGNATEEMVASILSQCWPPGLIARVTPVAKIERTLTGKRLRT
jgi:acyl-coenzyme A synthetase/AMP-(fatty) acid ligase